MSIFVDENTKVMCQGLTGSQGAKEGGPVPGTSFIDCLEACEADLNRVAPWRAG